MGKAYAATSHESISSPSSPNYCTDDMLDDTALEEVDDVSVDDVSSPASDFDETSEYNGTAVLPPDTSRKTVLVTGGAGFIGSHCASQLLSRGDDVVIIDDFNDYYDPMHKRGNVSLLRNHANSQNLTVHAGDICDGALLTKVFKDHAITHVVHLAARAGVRPSIEQPLLYIQTNVTGTTMLLEMARLHNVKNFVYASSSSVYGGSKSKYFVETEDVSNPVSQYAATKKTCELLAHTYSHLYGLNTTGLRFFTVYGERGRPDMAPYMFIDRIANGESIKQFGDGSSSRDYTYVSDIVDGVLRSVDRSYKNEVFNLGKGSGTSLLEFIETVEKYTKRKAKRIIMPDQPGDVPYTCASTSKAKALLGYEARVTFDEGIRRTVEWFFESQMGGVKKEEVAAVSKKVRREEKDAETSIVEGAVKRMKTAVSVAAELSVQ
jgi:UDP-glucuronate 4-epimerase